MSEPILQVKDVVKHYPLTRGIIFKKRSGKCSAVDGVSFDLKPARPRASWASPDVASPRWPG